MGMNSRRVLVVEDERDIARLLALHLEDLGCESTRVTTDAPASREPWTEPRGVSFVLDLRLRSSMGLKSVAAYASSTNVTRRSDADRARPAS